MWWSQDDEIACRSGPKPSFDMMQTATYPPRTTPTSALPTPALETTAPRPATPVPCQHVLRAVFLALLAAGRRPLQHGGPPVPVVGLVAHCMPSRGPVLVRIPVTEHAHDHSLMSSF